MRGAEDKRDLGLVIVLLRAILDWNRLTLSQKSGIDEDLLADYEHGLRSPIPRNRARLAKAFGVEPSFLADLVPVCRSLRLAYERAVRGGRGAAPSPAEISRRLEGRVTGAVLEAMAPFLLELRELDVRPLPRAEDRTWARELWADLAPLSAESQGRLVQALLGDERSWALAVEICEASCAAAPHSAAGALRLAQLGIDLAQEASGPEAWLALLLGFCELFRANALRVSGTLASAREALGRSDELWSQGESGDSEGLLDSNRRLDLKADFLKYDGRTEEARLLLDQAMRGEGTGRAHGRLLIQQATSQEIAGEYEAAIETLRQAELLIDAEPEPRLLFACFFNRAVNECHLDRYQNAEQLLPRVEELVANLRTELDGVRNLWLKGRTWAGLGRREDAIAALAEVRRDLLDKKIAYDFALVSLELATLYLEQGRTLLVKELAEEMLWIFEGEKVHTEALAAVALFQQAAQVEKARAEWTRQLVKYLYRAEHNPNLRFEA
jgi:tetratricopeptide (TPR) repeat protein/transcriptional regulator with XRE-family HTH domain